MESFEPDPRGFISSVPFFYGSYSRQRYEGELQRFLNQEVTDYDKFAKTIEEALLNKKIGGRRGWAMEYDTARRWCRSQERVLTIQLIRELMDPTADEAREKYTRAMLQQIRRNNGQDLRYRYEQLHDEEIPEI